MFGSVEIRSRPLRLGLLVDHDNASQVLEAIQLATSLWGGNYFPIIPTFKRLPRYLRERHFQAPSAATYISGYVDAFDPDVLVQFSDEIPPYLTKRGLEVIRPATVWEHSSSNGLPCPQYGIGLFEVMDDIFAKYFRFISKYPIRIAIPRLPKQHRLFWASLLGDIPPRLLPQVNQLFSKHLDFNSVDITPGFFSGLAANDVLYPRNMTQHALNPEPAFPSIPATSIFLMNATRVEDIVDFWNLRALGGHVLPLPAQFRGDPHLRKYIDNLIEASRLPARPHRSIYDNVAIFGSHNTSSQEQEEFVRTLPTTRKPGDSPFDDPFSLHHYPRIWDSWARSRDMANPVELIAEKRTLDIADNDSLTIRFRPIIPGFASKFGHGLTPYCANGISFRFYGSKPFLSEALPSSPGRNVLKAISSITAGRGEWRIGRIGLSKLVENDSSFAWTIPESQELFFGFLRDYGWVPQLSSPGTIAKQIHSMLGGDIRTIAEEKLLGLLEHMNGGNARRDGTPLDTNLIHQERDLPVGEVKRRLAGISPKGDLHRQLVSKGFFRLGLSIKCPSCGRESFYSIDLVRETLSCPKCLGFFPSIGSVDSAQWHYRTSGPFSIPRYAEGSYAVLLALDFLGGLKMSHLKISPCLSFVAQTPEGKKIEADFAAFWEDTDLWETKRGLIFGECKTYGMFSKRDVDRMALLARAFPGSVLAFCTLRRTLTRAEMSAISALARKGVKYGKGGSLRNPVLILTGSELLSFLGPPKCWKTLGLDKRFERTHTLMEVCDATQQIHLKLPPWHEQWDAQRQSRSRRRKRKLPTDSVLVPPHAED